MSYETESDIGQTSESRSLSQRRIPNEIARKMHIEQFWDPRNHPEPMDPRKYALNRLDHYLPEAGSVILEQLNYEQAMLILALVEAGNRATAKQAIENPQLLLQRQDLLIKAIAQEVNLRRSSGNGWRQEWSNLPMTEIKREADELSHDYGDWIARWKNDLENLDLSDNS